MRFAFNSQRGLGEIFSENDAANRLSPYILLHLCNIYSIYSTLQNRSSGSPGTPCLVISNWGFLQWQSLPKIATGLVI